MRKISQQAAVLLVVLFLAVGVLPANAAPVGPLGIFSLTKSASPSGGVYPGQEITYTLNIGNSGTGSNAFLADPIPANTGYVAGSVTGGAYYETSGDRIVWNKSPLPSGGSATIQFKVLVDSGIAAGTLITNTATLYDSDPDTGGLPTQDATTTNTVLNPLTVSKTGPATAVIPPSAAASDTITYTISLQNNGPVSLTAGVDDVAPAGTKYKSATATTGSFSQHNNAGIKWSGSLASSGSVTITYAITTGVNITTGHKIVNQATVTNSKTTDSKIAGPVTTTVQGPISASKTVDKSSAYPGETLHYTIDVQNVSS